MFKKIDLYFNGDYLFSTNMAKTCKEAKNKYINMIENRSDCNLSLVDRQIKKNPKGLTAYFDKTKG